MEPEFERQARSPRGGLTPLMYAARDGRISAVKALIENGAKLNSQSADKSTALLIATINGHYDVAKYLVEQGADVTLASIDDATPLYGVLHVQWSRESERPQPSIKRESTSYLELMRLMLDRGANPNARLGKTLWYTSFGNPYEAASDIGTTPFWKCAAVGDLDGMKLLLSRGADPNLPNKDGVTALLIAAGAGTHGNDDIEAPPGRMAAVRYLVEDLHLDVNAADNGASGRRDMGQQQAQQTPPAPAQPGQQQGQEQQQQNPFRGTAAGGYTALHNAASRGDNEMILYLVSKGAKVDVITKTGVTVVDMANGPRQRVQPYASTIALLEMLGAKNSHKCISC
jgi:ankyrin repeat protein